MKRLFIIILSLGYAFLNAQNNEFADGKWKLGMKGSVNNITATELRQEKWYTDQFHKMIYANYKPKGVDVTYTDAHGYEKDEEETWFANPFYYAAYLVKPGSGESGTNMFIYANSLEWIAPMRCVVGKNIPQFCYLNAMPVKDENGWVFNISPEWDIDKDSKSFMAYLITYPDKLPYMPVSRKEYLETMRTKIQKDKDETLKNMKVEIYYPIRTKAEQEAALQKKLDEIDKGGFGEDATKARKNRILKDYKTDEQIREEAIEKTTKYYTNSLDTIDNELKNSSENELQQQAIVKGNYTYEFSGFATENDRDTQYVIQLNKSYFDSKLPRSAPQFITVFFKNSEYKNEVYKNAINEIHSAVDFNLLQNMLGKKTPLK